MLWHNQNLEAVAVYTGEKTSSLVERTARAAATMLLDAEGKNAVNALGTSTTAAVHLTEDMLDNLVFEALPEILRRDTEQRQHQETSDDHAESINFVDLVFSAQKQIYLQNSYNNTIGSSMISPSRQSATAKRLQYVNKLAELNLIPSLQKMKQILEQKVSPTEKKTNFARKFITDGASAETMLAALCFAGFNEIREKVVLQMKSSSVHNSLASEKKKATTKPKINLKNELKIQLENSFFNVRMPQFTELLLEHADVQSSVSARNAIAVLARLNLQGGFAETFLQAVSSAAEQREQLLQNVLGGKSNRSHDGDHLTTRERHRVTSFSSSKQQILSQASYFKRYLKPEIDLEQDLDLHLMTNVIRTAEDRIFSPTAVLEAVRESLLATPGADGEQLRVFNANATASSTSRGASGVDGKRTSSASSSSTDCTLVFVLQQEGEDFVSIDGDAHENVETSTTKVLVADILPPKSAVSSTDMRFVNIKHDIWRMENLFSENKDFEILTLFSDEIGGDGDHDVEVDYGLVGKKILEKVQAKLQFGLRTGSPAVATPLVEHVFVSAGEGAASARAEQESSPEDATASSENNYVKRVVRGGLLKPGAAASTADIEDIVVPKDRGGSEGVVAGKATSYKVVEVQNAPAHKAVDVQNLSAMAAGAEITAPPQQVNENLQHPASAQSIPLAQQPLAGSQLHAANPETNSTAAREDEKVISSPELRSSTSESLTDTVDIREAVLELVESGEGDIPELLLIKLEETLAGDEEDEEKLKEIYKELLEAQKDQHQPVLSSTQAAAASVGREPVNGAKELLHDIEAASAEANTKVEQIAMKNPAAPTDIDHDKNPTTAAQIRTVAEIRKDVLENKASDSWELAPMRLLAKNSDLRTKRAFLEKNKVAEVFYIPQDKSVHEKLRQKREQESVMDLEKLRKMKSSKSTAGSRGADKGGTTTSSLIKRGAGHDKVETKSRSVHAATSASWQHVLEDAEPEDVRTAEGEGLGFVVPTSREHVEPRKQIKPKPRQLRQESAEEMLARLKNAGSMRRSNVGGGSGSASFRQGDAAATLDGGSGSYSPLREVRQKSQYYNNAVQRNTRRMNRSYEELKDVLSGAETENEKLNDITPATSRPDNTSTTQNSSADATADQSSGRVDDAIGGAGKAVTNDESKQFEEAAKRIMQGTMRPKHTVSATTAI
ncbi:unnamed protein product [Amoebophrya sp. A120]|nr:unnamed protein product [Amoebophrya sp. A120]|eukprot:GSA120T00003847001.1